MEAVEITVTSNDWEANRLQALREEHRAIAQAMQILKDIKPIATAAQDRREYNTVVNQLTAQAMLVRREIGELLAQRFVDAEADPQPYNIPLESDSN